MNDAPPPAPFQALLDDIAELQATRYRPARQRDTVSRATAPRPMAKAAPTRPADFDRIAAEQEKLAKAMQQTRQQQVQQQVRDRIAGLRADAKAGRLSALEAAKLDALIGQAAKMGLRP